MTRRWTDRGLAIALQTNVTFSGVLRDLGLSRSPGNWRLVRARIATLGLSTSGLRGKAHGTTIPGNRRDLGELLVQNGPYIGSHSLKQRLLREGLLRKVCSACDLGPEWRGRPLGLELDHRNGECTDNRLENLRLLCPNCHSQMKKAVGTNSGRYRAPDHRCVDCTAKVFRGSERCNRCRGLRARDKSDWPPAKELAERVARSSYSEIARELGVSDNGLRKHIKRSLGVLVPRRRGPRPRAA